MSHDAVYLHVGVPKTGTTYLQEFLWTNRERLAESGLLYPADRAGHQFHAVLDLEGSGFAGNQMAGIEGAWAAVTAKAKAWEGRSVISHELLGGLAPARVAEAMAALAPRPVHVILTLRDLSRIVPAVWQEDAKNRFVESWPEFLDRVRPGEDPRDPMFWRLQDVPAILGRWTEHVPGDRIHVVTVPPAGSPRHLLLTRFAQVIGIDPDDYQQDVKVANDSIGPAEVALLHRINQVDVDRLPWPAYHHSIKHFAVTRVLAQRPEEGRVTVPDAELGWVNDEFKRTRAVIEESGLDVVGDLDDLTPRPLRTNVVDPSAVTADQQLDAAVDLTAGLAARLFTVNTNLTRARDELAKAHARIAELQVTRVEKAKRVIVRLGRRNRAVDAVLNLYRSRRERR